MRLLNIETHQLETFDKWDMVPPYAILSHTWEEGEVLFQDIHTDSAKSKQGWRKILGACAEAEKLGIFYVWVDTCCICKESSAELSTSINSMFAWYRDARVCFAYMEDFEENADREAFDTSKLWTRGWTLQELIAPVEVMFFNKNWGFVDLRSSLVVRIAKITGIAEEILRGGNLDKLHDFSIAEKFSWAAKRRTTCEEDRAYSLMGLFGVNMSMTYGEGEQAAFYRLQKRIFEVYADHSMFAWQRPCQEMQLCDLLAPSVSAFESSADIISEPYDWDVIGWRKEEKPKTFANKPVIPLAKYSAISHGVRVQMLLRKESDTHYAAYLACRFRANQGTFLTIMLALDKKAGQYRRVSHVELAEIPVSLCTGISVKIVDVYLAAPRVNFALSTRPVRYQIPNPCFTPSSDTFFSLQDDAVYTLGFTLVDYSPSEFGWRQSRSDLSTQAPPRMRLWYHDTNTSAIYRNKETTESFAVVIGTSQKFRSEPQEFLVGIIDNVGPDASVSALLDDFFQHSNHLLTDLSTKMLIKPLGSGRHVILSVNVTREQAEAKPLNIASAQNFKLWIVVKDVE